MSYKSPIDIVMGGFHTQIENNVFKAVKECGISVDKDELIKALKYDRDQYEHGFTDGYWAGKNEIVRCKDCRYCEIRYPSKTINEEPKEVHSCQVHWHMVLPDGYCSYGERKEQKDD